MEIKPVREWKPQTADDILSDMKALYLMEKTNDKKGYKMPTIKLYKITCTKGYPAGQSFSLEPWASTATQYEGYDDGGKDYILPDGYEVAAYQSQPGNGIFHGYKHCEIKMHESGLPQLINNKSFTPVDGWTVLEVAP